MGIPFSVVQGTIFITDAAGNITDVVTPSDPGGKNRLATQTKIIGRDGLYEADVELVAGKRKLLTDATVTVESVFGFDDFADVWFEILSAGAINDTITINIAAGAHDPTAPDRDPAAYTKIYTLIAGDVGDEIALRDRIITALNADILFNPHWKATAIKDNAIIHIGSKYIGEFGERPVSGNFTVVASGTTTVQAAFDHIKRRGKQNSGAKDPRDKRLVTIGISGEVQAVPGSVGDLIIKNALNAGSPIMAVNGSVTPMVFSIAADADKDEFFSELRFYGQANGIKFGQFLSINTILANGILVEIKSDDIVLTLPIIKSTDDFKHKFAFGTGSGFQLHIQAGRDDFMASFSFQATFPIRKIGTYVTDDYIRVTIRDNLSTVQSLEFLASGFKKEV